MHNKDKALLELIQSYFGGIGGFSEWNNKILYRVNSIKDISNVIIPHLSPKAQILKLGGGKRNTPPCLSLFLLSQKRADFELFKLAVELMNKKEHLTSEGLI